VLSDRASPVRIYTTSTARRQDRAISHQPSVALPVEGEPSTPCGDVTIPASIARRQLLLPVAAADAPLSGSLLACLSGTVGIVGVLQMVASCRCRRPTYGSVNRQ
jgi:hypothetical protein